MVSPTLKQYQEEKRQGCYDTWHPIYWPKRYKPLPQGYTVMRMDDHFLWVYSEGELKDYEREGSICWDRYRVRREAFMDAKEKHGS